MAAAFIYQCNCGTITFKAGAGVNGLAAIGNQDQYRDYNMHQALKNHTTKINDNF